LIHATPREASAATGIGIATIHGGDWCAIWHFLGRTEEAKPSAINEFRIGILRILGNLFRREAGVGASQGMVKLNVFRSSCRQ
jgi:hypothetical protein